MKRIVFKKQEKGAALIIAVVVITVVSLALALNASFLGIGELDAGYTSARGSEALSVADGCMEESLNRIRRDSAYGLVTSPISLNLGSGSCIIDIIDLGGGQRRITVTGTVLVFNKRIQAEALIGGSSVTLTSWEELDN